VDLLKSPSPALDARSRAGKARNHNCSALETRHSPMCCFDIGSTLSGPAVAVSHYHSVAATCNYPTQNVNRTSPAPLQSWLQDRDSGFKEVRKLILMEIHWRFNMMSWLLNMDVGAKIEIFFMAADCLLAMAQMRRRRPHAQVHSKQRNMYYCTKEPGTGPEARQSSFRHTHND
jgi:hypothetical protein